MIKAAINGSRSAGDHPAVPIGPEELAREARGSVGAGAFAIHVHPRDLDGAESLDAADVARAVAAIRSARPPAPVGVTTGAWIVPDPEERLAKVRRWTVLPDFASVNFHEAGAAELARALLEMGIGFEAGLATPEAVGAFHSSGLGRRAVRILLEPMQVTLPAARENLAAIERELGKSPGDVPRLLHGAGVPVWDLVRLAARRGYDSRVGLEDTLTLPDGRPAPDNAALVAEAVRLSRAGSSGS